VQSVHCMNHFAPGMDEVYHEEKLWYRGGY
jgi:hypothetical protein